MVIVEIQNHLKQEYDIAQKYSTRYLAIKLLENDKEAEQIVSAFPDATEIMKHRDETAQRVKEETRTKTAKRLLWTQSMDLYTGLCKKPTTPLAVVKTHTQQHVP